MYDSNKIVDAWWDGSFFREKLIVSIEERDGLVCLVVGWVAQRNKEGGVGWMLRAPDDELVVGYVDVNNQFSHDVVMCEAVYAMRSRGWLPDGVDIVNCD